MTTVYDVNANELISEVSKSLKEVKDLKAPAWAVFVKTGSHKERPPESKDWWYIRLASLLRGLYIRSPVGIQRLRTKYGGRRKVGYRPKRHIKAGGKIIRTALQMLEKQGLVANVPKKGRVLTNKGKSLLDKTAAKLVRRVKRPVLSKAKRSDSDVKKEEAPKKAEPEKKPALKVEKKAEPVKKVEKK